MVIMSLINESEGDTLSILHYYGKRSLFFSSPSTAGTVMTMTSTLCDGLDMQTGCEMIQVTPVKPTQLLFLVLLFLHPRCFIFFPTVSYLPDVVV